MKPILFAANAASFASNGIGRIDCISCKVTEERNGIYELTMEVAEGSDHVSDIAMSSIIVAKPSQGKDPQPFRVYKITKPINGRFEIYAQHISYQLCFIPTMPFSIVASSGACDQTLQALKTNAVETCPFTFWTNVTTVASYQQTVPASIRSRLGGVDGSVLAQFGGEFEWDVYDVKLWSNRGVTTQSVSLRYGKNIVDLDQEENIENTITGIVPFWQSSEGDTIVTLTEKVVESAYASSYPFKRTVPCDFSQDFQNEPTENELRTRAQAYVNQSGLGIPAVSIKVSFVNLSDTQDYKDIAALQVVNLCDVVGVYFEKLGISTTAKVIKTVYDVLAERYDSVEIGALRSTLAGTISDNASAISEAANNTKRMFKSYNSTVNELVDNATAWLTGSDGYVIAVKNTDGTWKELIFADHNDPSEWVNVLRINENGIGFSSDGGQNYTQAWTLDGKLVIGGTDVPSLTVYDNATPTPNILFQISSSGLQWNATNSSMTTSGLLTAIGATLQNATISSTRGTGNNRYSVVIEDGSLIFQKNDSDTASIEYKALSSGSALIMSSTYDAQINSEQWATVYGKSAVQIGTNGGDIYLDGEVWINTDPRPGTTSYQSINYANAYNGVIQDFDWDYDSNTGCIDRIYNFVRHALWY